MSSYRCCVRIGRFDHRFIPLSQTLECRHFFKSGPERKQTWTYWTGISVAILSKDYDELERSAKLSHALQTSCPDKAIVDAQCSDYGLRGDQLGDAVLACRDLGIAFASRAKWQDALKCLELARQIQESPAMTKGIFPGPKVLPSKERHERRLFDIYYHLGMVHGYLRNKYATKGEDQEAGMKHSRESDAHFEKALNFSKTLPTREAKLR